MRDRRRMGAGFHLHKLFINLGTQAERAGEYEAALEMFQRAVQAEPQSALAWYDLGTTLFGLKRHAEARAALERAHALAPDNPLCRYDFGLVLHELGEHQRAIELFQPLVAEDRKLQRPSSHLVPAAMTNLASMPLRN